jgi:tRNA U34 5-methylaminomethyl-2-thiouridine-forming methyltransferase MnmC
MTSILHSPRLGLNEVYVVSTRDGSETLFSNKFASTYHSMYGAVSESRHVFIQHGLQTQLGKTELNVLELGFGTGLNAFLAYLFSIKHKVKLSYVGIEAFPIELEVAVKLDYPGYLAAKDEAEIFMRMHEMDSFEMDGFSFNRSPSWDWFTKGLEYDCIFFDAFHPVAQPELWSQDIFDAMFKVTAAKGCLVTYCAQGEVRRKMQKAGFTVDRIAGATGKREMLRAIKGT